MDSRLAIFLLIVMTACLAVCVYAQDQQPNTVPSWPPVLSPERPEGLPDEVPWPPPVDKLPPPPEYVTRPLPLQDPPSPPPLTPPRTPPETPATSKLPLIAGRPYEEALAILKRHEPELINLPGADGVSMDGEGIIIYTDNPAVIPVLVEGLPVRSAPPLASRRTLPSNPPDISPSVPEPSIAGIPYKDAATILARHQEELMRMPGVQGAILGADGIEVYTTNPAALPTKVEGLPVNPLPPLPLLPPPPGVIVLRSGGAREQAESCPSEFKEHVSLGGWRFCLAPGYSGPIPPLMALPIAGVSYEESCGP